MTTNDFDQAFGSTTPRSGNFAQRVGKADPLREGETSVGSGAYKPYGFLPTNAINESCEVVRWIEGTEEFEGIEFPYRLLMEVAFSGDEQLRLHLPTCIITIDGKHLRDLRKKLARRQVTFIQQYSARVWPDQTPAPESIVTNIQVVRPTLERN